jgi:hypothetical protein
MSSANEGSNPRNLGARMYGEPSPETPRRLNAATVLQMLHDERMAQVTKPSREDRPRITLKRSTASGSLGVIGIDIDVPVCEDFPSSAEAQAEAMRLMDELSARYPLPPK